MRLYINALGILAGIWLDDLYFLLDDFPVIDTAPPLPGFPEYVGGEAKRNDNTLGKSDGSRELFSVPLAPLDYRAAFEADGRLLCVSCSDRASQVGVFSINPARPKLMTGLKLSEMPSHHRIKPGVFVYMGRIAFKIPNYYTISYCNATKASHNTTRISKGYPPNLAHRHTGVYLNLYRVHRKLLEQAWSVGRKRPCYFRLQGRATQPASISCTMHTAPAKSSFKAHGFFSNRAVCKTNRHAPSKTRSSSELEERRPSCILSAVLMSACLSTPGTNA